MANCCPGEEEEEKKETRSPSDEKSDAIQGPKIECKMLNTHQGQLINSDAVS